MQTEHPNDALLALQDKQQLEESGGGVAVWCGGGVVVGWRWGEHHTI